MAKKKTYDVSDLTEEELQAILDSLKGKKNNNLAGYEAALADALAKKKADDWNANEGQKYIEDLQNIMGGSTQMGNGGGLAYTFGTTLASRMIDQMNAGIDIYSDPYNQAFLQYANENGWSLPDIPGIDYDRFVRDYQDQRYITELQNGPQEGFNFGFDPNNLPAGIDEDTLARMSMASLVKPYEPEPVYTSGSVELAPRNQTPAEPRLRYADLVYGTTPRSSNAPNGGVATGDVARNGTRGWLSDEYPNINTVTENGYTDITWDNDARGRLAEAMGVNGYGENIGAIPTENMYTIPAAQAFYSQGGADTGYAAQNTAPDRTEMYFRDYASKRNPASSGNGTGTGGTRSRTTRTSFPRTNSVQAQENTYNSMIDALVRGSNGGSPNSNGMTLANAVYDNSRRVGITDPKPVYSQYAATTGNPLARDKDYSYLNRLLNIKK